MKTKENELFVCFISQMFFRLIVLDITL